MLYFRKYGTTSLSTLVDLTHDDWVPVLSFSTRAQVKMSSSCAVALTRVLLQALGARACQRTATSQRAVMTDVHRSSHLNTIAMLQSRNLRVARQKCAVVGVSQGALALPHPPRLQSSMPVSSRCLSSTRYSCSDSGVGGDGGGGQSPREGKAAQERLVRKRSTIFTGIFCFVSLDAVSASVYSMSNCAWLQGCMPCGRSLRGLC